MEKKVKLKAKAAWVIPLLGLLATIVIGSKTIMNTRYNEDCLSAPNELIMVYKKSTPQTAGVNLDPCTGYVKWGWKQTKGKKKTTYKLSYKKTTDTNYICKVQHNFKKNSTWEGPNYLVYADGYTDYNIEIKRVKGKKKTSRLVVDFMVTS